MWHKAIWKGHPMRLELTRVFFPNDWPKLSDPFVSQNHKWSCVFHSLGQILLCINHCFVWSKINFLHNSQHITLPTQSCLILYYICASLLHLLIMWLIVSSLPPQKLYLLFCCFLFSPALIWLVLLALFCGATRKYSVSLLQFPFLSHVHVFSCEMILVCRLK